MVLKLEQLIKRVLLFVGTTVEKGMRIITVVLNANNQDTNPYARFTATSALLDYISSNFALQTIVKQGESYQDSKSPVLDGKQDTVTAVAKEDIKNCSTPWKSSTVICYLHT